MNQYHSYNEVVNSSLFKKIIEESEPRKHKSIELDPDVLLIKEINDFYEENNREPEKTMDPTRLKERRLFSNLKGLRENIERRSKLDDYDKFNLLKPKKLEGKIDSISDIISKGSNDLLKGNLEGFSSLFDTSRYKTIEKEQPEYRATHKKLKNFAEYEPLFKMVHKDIAEGRRKIILFAKEQQVEIGDFFVLRGLITYVADKGEEFEKNGRKNARLRLIYENGTTSNNLLRSFSSELYKDGKRITESEDLLLENDVSAGYIYILRSLSEDPQIKNINNLYKIGVTTRSVERRVANAENESTFLYAPVEIIAKYHVYNIKANQFENALQKAFSDKNLDVGIVANNGRLIVPKEWFVVELDEIDETINKIITTINYI